MCAALYQKLLAPQTPALDTPPPSPPANAPPQAGLPALADTRAAQCLLTLLFLVLSATLPSPVSAQPSNHSWGHSLIVTTGDGDQQFTVDGKPFFLWGASFFYERLPKDRWRHSLAWLKTLGYNTIDLYIPWNWHEVADGEFDFDGHTNERRDLRSLIELIRQSDFKVILRPGPVIRNEWRNGGYPAWLLERPEYDMAQHERLEGRYPPTATLQNAHSDDAAAEWMNNPTHMRYASRWLTTVLHEFQPIADRVIAVQLDDDQAAYIDNQTYPAPHLHAYLNWLRERVHAATAPSVPVYINTYQPKVPASLPVWEWGNWYQGGSYQLGQHDLNDLEFSTLLLQSQRYGPVMQSEFQAGWLAAPEDQQPRPSAPTSTTLGLYKLLALGVKGIIDFPPQDTLAPAGWEAPFTNWFYAWDAALPYEPAPSPPGGDTIPATRFEATLAFGGFVRLFSDQLAQTHRVADGAIAYTSSAYAAVSPQRLTTIVNATQRALAQCDDAGLACDVVDLGSISARKLARYRFLVVPIMPVMADADADPGALHAYRAALEHYAHTHPGMIAGRPPKGLLPLSGSRYATLLEGPRGERFTVAINAGDKPQLIGRVSVAPHMARLLPSAVSLKNAGAEFSERDSLVATTRLGLPSADKAPDYPNRVTIGSNLTLHAPDVRPVSGGAVAYAADFLHDGSAPLLLENKLVRIAIDPQAGGRAFLFEDKNAKQSAFNMTGALRDDVARQMELSKRDYIAAYTHSYPAGTFNRLYKAEILESGKRAVVRLSYDMPDALPSGARFEKTITLEPDAREFSMTEHVTFPADSPADPQHGVSLASLSPGPGAPADWITMTAPSGLGIFNASAKLLSTVTWNPAELEGEELKPYRSSITLFMRYAPGVTATTTYGVFTADDETAARKQFAEVISAAKAALRGTATGWQNEASLRGSGGMADAVASKATE